MLSCIYATYKVNVQYVKYILYTEYNQELKYISDREIKIAFCLMIKKVSVFKTECFVYKQAFEVKVEIRNN